MTAIIIDFEESRKRLRPRAEDFFDAWAKQTFTSTDMSEEVDKYLEGGGHISGNICNSGIIISEEEIYESLGEMTHINDILKLFGDKYNRNEEISNE